MPFLCRRQITASRALYASWHYFGLELAVALAIGSVSLFADSIDFLEDASVNLLIMVALGWRARNRARLGMVLACLLLVQGLATLWTAWEKFNTPLARSHCRYHWLVSVRSRST